MSKKRTKRMTVRVEAYKHRTVTDENSKYTSATTATAKVAEKARASSATVRQIVVTGSATCVTRTKFASITGTNRVPRAIAPRNQR